MGNKRGALWGQSIDVLYDIVGSVAYALGTICFVAPSNIAPGGASGIAIMLNFLFGWPIGITTFVINIPLLLLALRFLGRKFTMRTIRSVVISTVVMDFVVAPISVAIDIPKLLGTIYGDRLLGALFGGVLVGAGLGIIFLRDSTTGGTDIAGRLLRLKFPHLQMGRAMLVFDATVLIVSIGVFGSLESGLYGMITIFVTSRVIDGMLYGVDRGNMVLVVSEQTAAIAPDLMQELDRGVTFLKGQGAYSGKDTDVLVSAVRKSEFHRLRTIVYEHDPKAFIIVTEAGEILGEGFKPMVK